MAPMNEQPSPSEIQLVCASHSPLLYCYARKPERYDEIEEVFATRRAAIEAFDPELVVMFGSDHFNGFFLNMMPSFCVGLAATAAGDIGGFEGSLDVPSTTSIELVEHLRSGGVDVAVSYDMGIDHAFSQSIVRLLGSLDARPIVPVFVNCITKPFVPFHRTVALGEQVGRFVAASGQRVLLVASGGMSHNPLRYYPHYGTGDADVTEYQLHGPTPDDPPARGFSEPAWLDRLETMHIEGAQMLVDGTRTLADIKLNPPVDHEFLRHLLPLELEPLTSWDPDDLIERAGIGFMELQTWIAGAAAFRAAGGTSLELDIYAETLEYGIATGRRPRRDPLMRLLSYSIDSRTTFGMLSADGQGVIDLGARLADLPELGALLEVGVDAAAPHVSDAPDHALDAIAFERVLHWPRKIYCVGVNYVGRNDEYRDGIADTSYPSLFVRFGDSFVGHERPVIRPHESEQFDCEGEIVVVIGRPGRRIPIEQASDHMAGLTLGNDGTLRDWVKHGRFNVTQGKQFESTGSLGPWIVTMDELGELDDLHLTTHINGELIQDGTTATMQYPIEYLVSYVSSWATLLPGDMIFTGTPLGSRGRRNPPSWLIDGDVIEITVPEIGTLRNTVADEPGTAIAPPPPRA